MSYADYFPFGWQMPGRNQQGDYRYAYQGQEKDPETGWEAFELRMYDGRVGRWMTTDPYSQYHSPYLAMGNNPIQMIDPDGGWSGASGEPLPINDELSLALSLVPTTLLISYEVQTKIYRHSMDVGNGETLYFNTYHAQLTVFELEKGYRSNGYTTGWETTGFVDISIPLYTDAEGVTAVDRTYNEFGGMPFSVRPRDAVGVKLAGGWAKGGGVENSHIIVNTAIQITRPGGTLPSLGLGYGPVSLKFALEAKETSVTLRQEFYIYGGTLYVNRKSGYINCTGFEINHAKWLMLPKDIRTHRVQTAMDIF